MKGEMTSKAGAVTAVHAGINVCKVWPDVYLHPIGQ